MLGGSPAKSLLRVLNEKSCGSCATTRGGTVGTSVGEYGYLLWRSEFFDTFFGDQLPFLYSLHASLISQYLLGSSSLNLCSLVGCSDFSVKMAQNRYSRRFHATGIKWSPSMSRSTFSHADHTLSSKRR